MNIDIDKLLWRFKEARSYFEREELIYELTEVEHLPQDLIYLISKLSDCFI